MIAKTKMMNDGDDDGKCLDPSCVVHFSQFNLK